jgi:hypothetical protein
MKNVFLVKQEEADLARKMEAKILGLPASTGVLFVGVSVTPADERVPNPVYHVWVGCHRDFDAGLVDPLIRVTLRNEILAGAVITIEAHRGISRLA